MHRPISIIGRFVFLEEHKPTRRANPREMARLIGEYLATYARKRPTF